MTNGSYFAVICKTAHVFESMP